MHVPDNSHCLRVIACILTCVRVLLSLGRQIAVDKLGLVCVAGCIY